MKKMRERPLQIYLRPDQDTTLRDLARDQNVSIAELVRRSIDQMIATTPREKDSMWSIVALGSSSGAGETSENIDKRLVEIYKQESDRWHANSLSTHRRGSHSRTKKTTATRKRRKSTRSS